MMSDIIFGMLSCKSNKGSKGTYAESESFKLLITLGLELQGPT